MTDLRQAAQQALEALENERYVTKYTHIVEAVTALKAALAQPEQEPTPWRDMVVVTLVREGIDKHKARELADHFATLALLQDEPPPEWELINNIIAEYGLQAISFVAEWKAAQRPWVGLDVEDLAQIDTDEFWQVGNHMAIAMAVEAKLKEKNHD
jgi:hypothetical protein